MRLKLLANGLSSAFAPTLGGTLQKLASERAPFFLNDAFIDRDFRPQLCAFRDNRGVSQLGQRLTELLDEALGDFLNRLHESQEDTQLADRAAMLVLVLPEVSESEGLDREELGRLGSLLCDRIGRRLAEELGITVSRRSIRASGHAGVGSALAEALHEGDQLLIIAAVDSYSDRSRLNRLNEGRRLFSKDTQFGFVPGEAAGLLLFAPAGSEDRAKLVIAGAGNAIEAVTELLEDETRFNALSDSAFAACEMVLGKRNRRIGRWYADWNNSRYRATELAFAMHRINPFFLRDSVEPSYPALHFGDVGAAFGAVAIAMVQADLGTNNDVADAEPAPDYTLISGASTLKGLRSTILVSK